MPKLTAGYPFGLSEIKGHSMAPYLRGQEVRSIVRDSAEQVEAIYRATVAKRTGRLARETRIETFIGGRNNDRWCARLIAGAPYATFHEFGDTTNDGADELRDALHAWEAVN